MKPAYDSCFAKIITRINFASQLVGAPHRGATRLQPIRTVREISARIPIRLVQHLQLYQKIAQKATLLRLLGMSYHEIDQASLSVSPSLNELNLDFFAEGVGELDKRLQR